MKKYIYTFLVFFISMMDFAFSASPISVHKNWTLFKSVVNKKEMCYIVSLPTKKEGNYKRRGEPYALVSRIKGSDYDEVSMSSGFLYDPDKDIEVSISKRKFPMFSNEEKAWAYDRNDDVEMVKYMKKGTSMNVVGYSKLGFMANDTYSLMGFSEAYDNMIKLCK